ncbi:MAG: P-type conjugative transfer protein TrbG, partial [Mesorhizobium sp.]
MSFRTKIARATLNAVVIVSTTMASRFVLPSEALADGVTANEAKGIGISGQW